MIIAVINLTGNAGKTTISQLLLKPRIPDAVVCQIESINATLTQDDNKLKGDQFFDIQAEMDMNENVILDIGSSNVEKIIESFKTFEGAIQEIDYFVVPVSPDVKQQTDTNNTIKMLLDFNVNRKQIKMVLNCCDGLESEDLQESFNLLYKGKNAKLINEYLAIPFSQLFSRLNENNISYNELLENNTDFKKELMNKELSKSDRMTLSVLKSLKRLQLSFEKNLDNVFENLNLN